MIKEACFKVEKTLYDRIKSDLERAHPFAYERVGFAYAKSSVSGGILTVFIYDYMPVPDEEYEKDARAGATINSSAIRNALQETLNRKDSCFHVHLHPFKGKPSLSFTDKKGIFPLIPSFRTVNRDSVHGIFLLSSDKATAYVWIPGLDMPIEVKKISIVGYPMQQLAD